MPRTGQEESPDEVEAVIKALRELAYRKGMTRAKLHKAKAILEIMERRHPDADLAVQVERADVLIRQQVDNFRNVTDHRLLSAGLNLDGRAETSIDERLLVAIRELEVDHDLKLQSDTLLGRFRYDLLRELAWRILTGGPPTPVPTPPRSEFAVAARLVAQGRHGEATQLLRGVANSAEDIAVRRDAWRTIATMAVERNRYDDAESAFREALAVPVASRKGGQLAMAIDRYARRLTSEEEYDRAAAIVSEALRNFFWGGWLWRRYGCVKWYAGDLITAYAALSTALERDYPRSRVLHARGQVLAELGRYGEAIEELTEALTFARSDFSNAQLCSARAFSVGMSGDLDAALGEFAAAELIIPDSAWLHFWRASCQKHHGQTIEAQAGLKRALAASAVPLNRPKREQAVQLLGAWESS